MRRIYAIIIILLITQNSFGQFADTAQLNGYLRDTIKDRRPEKVTALQIQKGFLGISRFLLTKPTLSNTYVGYGNSSNILTGSSKFTFNETNNALVIGNSSLATGIGSISLGYFSKALGNYSYARGYGTVAPRNYQYTIGKYNDTSRKAIFDIGWGNNDFDRLTIFRIDSLGRSFFCVNNEDNDILSQWIDQYGYDRTTLKKTNNGGLFLGSFTGMSNTGQFNMGIGDNVMNAASTGNDNTGLGHFALAYNTSGSYNTAIGYLSLYKNTSGLFNTAMGFQACGQSVTANGITGIGAYSLRAATASGNTALGYGSGYNLVAGGTNTLIGYQTGYNLTSGAGNVFLGYNSGQNETGSNRLYVSNSSTSNPLIYGEFDNARVKINGKFQSTDTVTITTMGDSDSSNRAASTAWVKRYGSALTPILRSGTFTPNLTDFDNFLSGTAEPTTWMQIGNIVKVEGAAYIVPLTGGRVTFHIDLPVPTAISHTYALTGHGQSNVEYVSNITITGNSPENKAECTFLNPLGEAAQIFYSFQYTVE